MRKVNTNGSILISLIITLPFLILIVSSYLSLSISSFNVAKKDQYQTYAQFSADAGTDLAVQKVNLGAAWSGTIGEVELSNNSVVRTTYEVTVTDDVVSGNKLVTSIGRTYFPASSTSASATVKLDTTLRTINSGNFSIVTGVGGLIMENSSKVLGGDVFINGSLSMSNTSQIGLSISRTNVYVANQACPIPADATYPTLCNAGQNDNPITINHSAHIYGDVRANHQSNGSGMSNNGLVASSGVTPQSLPTHDRDAQKTASNAKCAATPTDCKTGAQASCSNGVRYWEADIKITGNVVLSNSCQVIVRGNVWITGNLELRNSASIVVADSLGTTRPDLMIDGANGINLRNSGALNVNLSDTGFQIITYWSSGACSPDCANVTGTDLYNSRDSVTIDLQQSASGENSIFYARWSRVEVSNTGSIGALIGQTIHLKNSGTITFGTSVGTGTSFWVIDGYRRTF